MSDPQAAWGVRWQAPWWRAMGAVAARVCAWSGLEPGASDERLAELAGCSRSYAGRVRRAVERGDVAVTWSTFPSHRVRWLRKLLEQRGDPIVLLAGWSGTAWRSRAQGARALGRSRHAGRLVHAVTEPGRPGRPRTRHGSRRWGRWRARHQVAHQAPAPPLDGQAPPRSSAGAQLELALDELAELRAQREPPRDRWPAWGGDPLCPGPDGTGAAPPYARASSTPPENFLNRQEFSPCRVGGVPLGGGGRGVRQHASGADRLRRLARSWGLAPPHGVVLARAVRAAGLEAVTRAVGRSAGLRLVRLGEPGAGVGYAWRELDAGWLPRRPARWLHAALAGATDVLEQAAAPEHQAAALEHAGAILCVPPGAITPWWAQNGRRPHDQAAAVRAPRSDLAWPACGFVQVSTVP